MFLTPLQLRADPAPDMWVLAAPLVWCDPVYGRIEVPLGFRSDLASIPRALRCLPALDPNGLSRRPAVAHDWLYACKRLSRDRADELLYAALIAEGAGRGAARTYKLAVNWFGGFAWRSDGVLTIHQFDSRENFRAWLKSAT